MRIRTAFIEDLDQLVTLFEEYRAFYHKPAQPEVAREFLRNRMNNKESVIYVAELKNKSLAGFVQLYPYFSSTNLKRLWLLNDLYVNPNYRGQGISGPAWSIRLWQNHNHAHDCWAGGRHRRRNIGGWTTGQRS